MQRMRIQNGFVFCAVSSLVLLPGCLDWFGWGAAKPASQKVAKQAHARPADKKIPAEGDGSKVLITMGGEPIVTEKSLESEIDKLGKASPELKEALGFMGDQIKFMIADQMILRRIVERYIQEQGVDTQTDYQQALECALTSARDAVNQQFFTKNLDVSVSDRDVRAYYDQEKERLLVSHGGRQTMGVPFDDEQKAQEFLNKVNEHKGDIEKTAELDGSVKDKLRDFGLVHEGSIGISPELREKVVAIRSSAIPVTQLIAIGEGEFWVVRVASEEGKKYREFDDIKDQLRSILQERKMGEAAAQMIDSLREKYDVKDMREIPQAPGGEEPEGEDADTAA